MTNKQFEDLMRAWHKVVHSQEVVERFDAEIVSQKDPGMLECYREGRRIALRNVDAAMEVFENHAHYRQFAITAVAYLLDPRNQLDVRCLVVEQEDESE